MNIKFLGRIFQGKKPCQVTETVHTIPAELKTAAESLSKKGNRAIEGFVHSQEFWEKEVAKCADQLMEQMTTRCEFDTMFTKKHDKQLYENVREFFASEYPSANDEVVTKYARQIIERKHQFYESAQKAMKRIRCEYPRDKDIKFMVTYDKNNPEKNNVYVLLHGSYDFLKFPSVKEFAAYGNNEMASYRHVYQNSSKFLDYWNF